MFKVFGLLVGFLLAGCSSQQQVQIAAARDKGCAVYAQLLPVANAAVALSKIDTAGAQAYLEARTVIQAVCSAPDVDSAGVAGLLAAVAIVQEVASKG